MERLRDNRKVAAVEAGINRLRLREQTMLLEAAGFSHVEVVWRYLPMAVVAAYKRSLE